MNYILNETRKKAHLGLLFFLFTLYLKPLFSQTNVTVISISLSDSVFCTYGMVRVNIKFANANDSAPIRIIYRYSDIQIKTEDTDWHHTDAIKSISMDELGYGEYYTGDSMLLNMDLYPLFIKNPLTYKNLYEKGGNVLIRATIKIYTDTLWARIDLYSNPINIYLPPFNANETAAFNFLHQKIEECGECYGALSLTSQELGGGINAASIPVYKNLINFHENTILASFAKVWIASIDCRDANFEPISLARKTEIQNIFNQVSQSPIFQLRELSDRIKECIN